MTVTVKVNLISFLFDISKQIEQGASSYKNAHNIQVALRISTSTLVKMSLYGEDAKYAIRSPSLTSFFLLSPTSWGPILSTTGAVSLLPSKYLSNAILFI